MTARPICEIAGEIRKVWNPVYFAARPYLDVMLQLDKITDTYISEGADDIVRHFLGNAQFWRGEDAKRIKAELRALLGEKEKRPKKTNAPRPRKEKKAPPVKESLEAKLYVELRCRWSPKMLAMVAAILGRDGDGVWSVTPCIYGSMTVTSDGFLIGNCGEHTGAFLGTYSDLRDNYSKLIASVDLTPEERAHAVNRFKVMVQDLHGYNGKAVG